MSQKSAAENSHLGPKVAGVLQRYGKCLELIPADSQFHDISVGLYEKDGVFTVWSFSRKAGVENRLSQIRDQVAALGELIPSETPKRSMEIYYEWLALTRSAVVHSPDNTRRPLWFKRPLKPTVKAYELPVG